MNRLKSIFVLWYPIAVLLILASAVITMVVRGPDLAWSGALLTTLPFIGLYIRATTSRPKSLRPPLAGSAQPSPMKFRRL